MEDWIQVISTLGFLIVACVSRAMYVKEQIKNNREDVKELNAMHTKEMDSFKEEIKEALNNNTIALTKLCEKLDRKEVNINEIK